MTVNCPACGRPNAAHRVRCLYCGASMPNPVAPPPAETRVLPANLDDLVSGALRKGKIEGLRAALERVTGLESQTGKGQIPAGPAASGEPCPTPVPASGPVVVVAGPDLEPAPALVAKLESGEAFERVRELAGRAVAAWTDGDLETSASALEALAGAVELARAVLAGATVSAGVWGGEAPSPPDKTSSSGTAPSPPEPGPGTPALPWPPPIILPPFRHPYMLVIDGQGAGDGVALLAKALQIDAVTTRLHARHSYPSAVLRSADREDLEQRVARVGRLTKIPARVLAREDLLSVAPPFAVVRAVSPGRLRIAAAPLWEMDLEPGAWPETDTREIDVDGFSLAVPGEVVIRRFREGSSQPKITRLRDASAHELSERRVHVLDLHGPARSVRLTLETTDFRNLPGYDQASSLRAYRGLIEQLEAWLPGIRLLGRRVCAAPEAMPAFGEGERSERLELSGWPTWEEHTRVCWLFACARPGAGATPA